MRQPLSDMSVLFFVQPWVFLLDSQYQSGDYLSMQRRARVNYNSIEMPCLPIGKLYTRGTRSRLQVLLVYCFTFNQCTQNTLGEVALWY
jgi:hypothetical protein